MLCTEPEHTVRREGSVLKHTLRKRQHCGLMFSLRCRAADCLARTHLPDPIGLVLLKSCPQGEEYSVVISSTISGLPHPHPHHHHPPLRSINSTSSNGLPCFRRWKKKKKSSLVTATSGPQTQMPPVSPPVAVSQATAEKHIGGA